MIVGAFILLRLAAQIKRLPPAWQFALGKESLFVSVSFSELRRYKQLGLSYSAALVLLYLQEQGPSPIGTIADAVGCSTRCVEMALAAIKRLGLLSGKNPKNISHDHDQHSHENKRTTNGFSETSEETIAPAPDVRHTDPLMARLCSYDVLPWCATQVLQQVERGELQREDVERQLAYHQIRLDNGFKFKSHPARFLFTAILKNYAPPAEASRQTSHSGNAARSMSVQRTAIERTFGIATLERRAEFEAIERARQDDENRRCSLLAMFANQCRRERGPRRKTPEQLLPLLEKHGLSLQELMRAIDRHEAEAVQAV